MHLYFQRQGDLFVMLNYVYVPKTELELDNNTVNLQ